MKTKSNLKKYSSLIYIPFMYGNLALFILSFIKICTENLAYSTLLGITSAFLLSFKVIEEYITTPSKNKSKISKNKSEIENNTKKIEALEDKIEELTSK